MSSIACVIRCVTPTRARVAAVQQVEPRPVARRRVASLLVALSPAERALVERRAARSVAASWLVEPPPVVSEAATVEVKRAE